MLKKKKQDLDAKSVREEALLGLGSKRKVFLHDDSVEGNSFYDDEYCE
jgi:uncharacterized protein YtpQ (UPF0354 family)